MSDLVIYDAADGVATITLNSPETRNLLSAEFTDQLLDALAKADSDINVRVGILTAAGNVFCAGGNIKDMHARRHHFAGNPAEIRRSYTNGVQRIARAMDRLETPLIAAINGPAIGAGFDITLMCDVRIASTEALFAESFIKLGLVSAAGGAWFLTRVVSAAVAAELSLTGERIGPERALQLGIISRICEPDVLLSEARSIAGMIAQNPPHAIRMNKRLLREAPQQTLEQSLDMAASFQAIAQHTEDHREAVAAVIEKRAPNYCSR